MLKHLAILDLKFLQSVLCVKYHFVFHLHSSFCDVLGVKFCVQYGPNPFLVI